jgi:hypothetical protein
VLNDWREKLLLEKIEKLNSEDISPLVTSLSSMVFYFTNLLYKKSLKIKLGKRNN